MTYVFAFAGGGGGTSTTGRAVPRAARYFVVGVGGVGGVGGVPFAPVLEVFLVGTAVAATTPAASAGRLFAYMGGADELDALRETDPEVSGVMVSGLEPFLQYERLRPSKEEKKEITGVLTRRGEVVVKSSKSDLQQRLEFILDRMRHCLESPKQRSYGQ